MKTKTQDQSFITKFVAQVHDVETRTFCSIAEGAFVL